MYYSQRSWLSMNTGVSEENTPPEKTTRRKISCQSTKSGAGEQFLPLDCRATVSARGPLRTHARAVAPVCFRGTRYLIRRMDKPSP